MISIEELHVDRPTSRNLKLCPFSALNVHFIPVSREVPEVVKYTSTPWSRLKGFELEFRPVMEKELENVLSVALEPFA